MTWISRYDLNMREFLDFLPLFFITFFLVFFLVVLPRKAAKRASKIVQYYRGKISWPLGTISLNFSEMRFRISRVGRGGGYSGGGSYPVMYSYVKSFPKFIIGSESCHKYALGPFLIMPSSKTIEISGRKCLVACSDISVIEKIEKLKDEPVVARLAAAFFIKDFHHLTISRQFHWRGLFFKRENVLRYTSLPEIVYENPDQLRPFLENLTEFCRMMDLTLGRNLKK